MPDILSRLRSAYAENPAEALQMLSELLRAADNRDEILQKAIGTWGAAMQEDICIEEMSELTKAIIKNRRGGKSYEMHVGTADILEEISDVQIMLDQMRLIYGDTAEQEKFKLERLRKRLDGDTP